MESAIGLFELNESVRQSLRQRFPAPVAVVAEIADLKENRSGHCYLELVEKKEGEDTIIASARATIWSFTYRTLKPFFETTTGRPLQRGMRVLVRVEVVFHELYGYSLNIKDIDPTFTVGDLQRKRREILERLTREGVIDMNRELSFPALPKTVAIISSPTAAGYGDFVDQLHRNPFGYAFHTRLFPALMQGEHTASSIIGALEQIYAYESLFDVVVIIRGGGSQADLDSFDSYDLAAHVAQFPLPVIAGIGHERDETILDRVACLSVKTPTAAAAFLIDAFAGQEALLDQLRGAFVQGARSLLEQTASRLAHCSARAESRTRLFVQTQESRMEQLRLRLKHQVYRKLENETTTTGEVRDRIDAGIRRLLTEQRHRLEVAQTAMRYADPRLILSRGFSITRVDGKAVCGVSDLRPGAVLETELYAGRIVSTVKETKN